jgi:hypothetical protein
MSSAEGGSGWVVPPGVEINVAVGEDAELTPELRQALDDLVRALEAPATAEVEGFKGCSTQCKAPGFQVCNPRTCPGQGTCAPNIIMPCANKGICSVIGAPIA